MHIHTQGLFKKPESVLTNQKPTNERDSLSMRVDTCRLERALEIIITHAIEETDGQVKVLVDCVAGGITTSDLLQEVIAGGGSRKARSSVGTGVAVSVVPAVVVG